MKKIDNIINVITKSGLKATQQRIAVLDALLKLKSHPTAEELYNYLRKSYPTISLATIYNTLDTFIKNGLVNVVKLSNDCARYDAIIDKHFHLYSKGKDQIADYFDQNLEEIVIEYLDKNKIDGFEVQEIQINLIGKFNNERNKNESDKQNRN